MNTCGTRHRLQALEQVGPGRRQHQQHGQRHADRRPGSRRGRRRSGRGSTGAIVSGPSVSVEQAGPGDEEDRRDDDDRRRRTGCPSQTRFTKKSNGIRLARAATQDRRVQAEPAPTSELGQAGREHHDQEHARAWPAGRRAWSQPAERACSSVKTARSIEPAMPGQRCARASRCGRPGRGARWRRRRGHVRPPAPSSRPSTRRPRRPSSGCRTTAAAARPARRSRRRSSRIPRIPADLVADGGVPERRVGVAEERQRQVVAAERRAEDRRQVAGGPGGRSRTRPGRRRRCPRHRRSPGRSARAARAPRPR